MIAYPRWLSAIAGLLMGTAVAFLVVGIALATDLYPHSRPMMRQSCEPTNGLWFCFAGTFGNAC